MAIKQEFFCPECGDFWDLEICLTCGYFDEELATVPGRLRRQPFKEEERDVYGNNRQGRRKRQ